MNVKFSAKVRNICEMKCIFAPRFVPTWGFILHFGLKGNRVRVPDSPAAVTFSRGLLNNVRTGIKPAPTEMPLLKKRWEGEQLKEVRRPARQHTPGTSEERNVGPRFRQRQC